VLGSMGKEGSRRECFPTLVHGFAVMRYCRLWNYLKMRTMNKHSICSRLIPIRREDRCSYIEMVQPIPFREGVKSTAGRNRGGWDDLLGIVAGGSGEPIIRKDM
jgi:hypothetical protein